MTLFLVAIGLGFAIGGLFAGLKYDKTPIIFRVWRSPIAWIGLFVFVSILVHAHQ